MNLQNVGAAIYTKVAEAVTAGKYKLVYEKDGNIYGSKLRIPTDSDDCFNTFAVVPAVEEFTVTEPIIAEDTVADMTAEKVEEPEAAIVEEREAPRSRRSRVQKVTGEEVTEVAE
jgi:hypothetical protein